MKYCSGTVDGIVKINYHMFMKKIKTSVGCLPVMMCTMFSDFCDKYSVVGEMELNQSIHAVILQLILTTCAAYGSNAIDSGSILHVMQQLFCLFSNCTC